MIEQLRVSRKRIRDSPFYIDSISSNAVLDEKKDPLLSALGLKNDFFPTELIVKPSKNRLRVLYRRLAREETDIQKLEKLYQQKDDFGEGDEADDENNDIFGEDKEEESEEDTDYLYQNYDDDEDYLDDEDDGGYDGKLFCDYFSKFITL